MRFQWDKVKEFLALPEGKQIVAGLIFIGFILCMVVIHDELKLDSKDKVINECVTECADEKVRMQIAFSDTMKVTLQQFEREKSAIYLNNIDKLEKEKEKRESYMDEALREARRTKATVKKASEGLKKIDNKVSKIVKDASQ